MIGPLIEDAGLRAMLARVEEWPETPSLAPETIHSARIRQYREYEFAVPYEEVADCGELVADGPDGPVRVKSYVPHGVDGAVAPTVIRFFGGGMVAGSPEYEDRTSRVIANRLGCRILFPSYRLAPEDPFPTGLNDCLTTIRWAWEHAEQLGVDRSRIVVNGHSAGGLMTLSAAVALADSPVRVARYVALEPTVGPPEPNASREQFGAGYYLDNDAIERCWALYLGDAEPTWRSAPALASDEQLRGLDPVTIITAELDPLRDEGEAFAARLEGLGVDVRLRRLPGMIHGSACYAGVSDSARAALDLLVEEIGAGLG